MKTRCLGYFCLVFLALELSFSVSAQEEGGSVSLSPSPPWVAAVDWDSDSAAPPEGLYEGAYYRLVDTQIDNTGPKPTYYREYVIELTSSSAVDVFSRISITHDPSYRTLELHDLQVIRDGVPIDKAETATVSKYRIESNAEARIYDGRITTDILLSDVRIGDVLRYSYSFRGDNPVFGGSFYASAEGGYGVATGHRHFSLRWPEGKPLHVVEHHAPFELEQSTKDGVTTYEFSVEHAAARTLDSNTPIWYEPWPRFELSELDSWDEVAQWAAPMYRRAAPNDQERSRLVREVFGEAYRGSRDIEKALRFVQEHVRYLGLEMGVSAYEPRSAVKTLARRFGDCKDKTVLLVALLRGRGVEAFPALVNTSMGPTLPDEAPTPRAFNHVIVYVETDEGPVWLDPTLAPQAGKLDEIAQPNYGYALVVRPGERELTPMASPRRERYPMTDSTLDLSAGVGAAANLEVINEYRFEAADNIRSQLERDGVTELGDRFEQYTVSQYDTAVQAQPLEVSTDGGTVRIKEHYVLESPWRGDPEEMFVALDLASVQGYIDVPTSRTRRDPYYLSHPVDVVQRFDVALPPEIDLASERFEEDNRFFTFLLESKYDPETHRVAVEYSYRSKAPFVQPDDFPDYVAACERASNVAGYYIEPPGADSLEDLAGADLILTLLYLLPFVLVFGAFLAWLLHKKREAIDDTVFYPVTTTKFLVLSIGTGGIYTIYWSYRQWRWLRDQQDADVLPVPRALFAGFFFSALAKHMRTYAEARKPRVGVIGEGPAVALMFLYIGANVVGARTDSTALWFGSVLAVFAIHLPLVKYVISANAPEVQQSVLASRIQPRHVCALVAVLSAVVTLTAVENFLWPTGQVARSDRLWPHQLSFLREHDLIGETGGPSFLHSSGVFDIRSGGFGVTDAGVFLYETRPTGDLSVQRYQFSDIRDVSVVGAGSFMEDTIVTIDPRNGRRIRLAIVPGETNTDHEAFVSELTRRWRKAKE